MIVCVDNASVCVFFVYPNICMHLHSCTYQLCVIHTAVNSVAPVSQPAPSDASLLVDVLGGADITPQPAIGGGNELFGMDSVDPEVTEGLKK